MSCYHPLKAFKIGVNPETGKDIFKVTSYGVDHVEYWPSDGQWHSVDTPILSSFGTQLNANFTELPCGQCIGCRLEYSRQWANRLMLELEYHTDAWFITLTYDEMHVPCSAVYDEGADEVQTHLTLDKRDVQKWMKRLRKAFSDCNIRYYLAGEYGEETFRPHYHAIVFGLHLDDLEVYEKRRGCVYYTSPSLQRTWSVLDEVTGEYLPIGRVLAAAVTWETCAYVARYVTKKLKGKEKHFYEENGLVPEFSLMSRKPGIARQWYEDHPDLYDYEYINIKTDTGGRKFKPPKYYNNLYDVDCPEESAELKEKRKKFAEEAKKAKMQNTELSYLELLAVEEANKIAKTKCLKRSGI